MLQVNPLASVKLCAFLNAISQKAINLVELATLQNDVVQCLVSFELVFPPSFFNIMTHLLVHLVKELPYWQVLEVRNAIDVMHLTKNLCVNLLGFMGVREAKGFT